MSVLLRFRTAANVLAIGAMVLLIVHVPYVLSQAPQPDDCVWRLDAAPNPPEYNCWGTPTECPLTCESFYCPQAWEFGNPCIQSAGTGGYLAYENYSSECNRPNPCQSTPHYYVPCATINIGPPPVFLAVKRCQGEDITHICYDCCQNGYGEWSYINNIRAKFGACPPEG